MFTTEQRDHVRERVIDLARSDPRITAGALIGSTAQGAQDEWSDLDLTFGVADGIDIEEVLGDWTETFNRELGALDHFDLRAGPSIYRVFLLSSGLEVDVSVTPQREFSARGPRFRSLFGDHREAPPAPQPDAHHLVGMCWHHVLHARSCIERGKPWQAEYWMSNLRDYTLAFACLRLGLDAIYARGVDRLPADVTAPLVDALVRSLDAPELRRALAAATTCFIRELEARDSVQSARLKPLLLEFGAPESDVARAE